MSVRLCVCPDTTRQVSSRERQLAKARVEKLKLDKAIGIKRMELETKGRKLLKDIDFLQGATEERLLEQKSTEEVKCKLDEVRRSRRIIDDLKTKSIQQAMFDTIGAVHIKMCRELFDEMDADGGGSLDMDEIRQLSISLGNRLTQSQLDAAMAEMDEDGGGAVDFHEFYAWWCSDKKVIIAGPVPDEVFSVVPW